MSRILAHHFRRVRTRGGGARDPALHLAPRSVHARSDPGESTAKTPKRENAKTRKEREEIWGWAWGVALDYAAWAIAGTLWLEIGHVGDT